MTEITHSDKPIATGTVMSRSNENTTITGHLVEEYGDTFIVVRNGGWNEYNKVDPKTIIKN